MCLFDAIECVDRDGELLHRKAWVEMISWEPRAFVYHNFLVLYSDCMLDILNADNFHMFSMLNYMVKLQEMKRKV